MIANNYLAGKEATARRPKAGKAIHRMKASIAFKSRPRVKCGLEHSSSLSSGFGHLFFIEQFQAGSDDFRHGIYDRTQNLGRDDFVGLRRQAAF